MWFMTLVARRVRTCGYSKAWPPTWHHVWRETNGPDFPPEFHDAVQAQKIIAWVTSLRPAERTPYLCKAFSVIQEQAMTRTQAPLMASLAPAFERELVMQARAKTMTERLQSFRSSVYFGIPGVRSVLELTVQDMEPIDSLYGGTAVFLKDSNGNMAKWMASRVPEEVQKGRTLRVRATVTDHRESHGVHYTVLSHVVLDAPKTTSHPKVRFSGRRSRKQSTGT